MAGDAFSPRESDEVRADHAEIHLPPPSLVPINVGLALTTTLVGFIDQVRNAFGPVVWAIGVLWLIGSCAVWFLAARSEFRALPDSADGHH